MNGTISEIQRFSIHDGPGIRTTVFMKGCNLKCLWCHNPETQNFEFQREYLVNRCTLCGKCVKKCPEHALSIENGKVHCNKNLCKSCFLCENVCLNSAIRIIGEKYSPEKLCNILFKDKKYYEKTGGGVTFSGGEPLLQHDFVFSCADILKKNGISVAIETALCVPESIVKESLNHFSFFMCDIKAIDPQLHEKITGEKNEQILSNIKFLASQNADVIIRIPIACSLNGTNDNILATAQFIKQSGLKNFELLKLHRHGDYKYDALDIENTFPDIPLTKDEDIRHFTDIINSIL